jgi:hypothetical protein
MIAPGDDYDWYKPLEFQEDELGTHRSSFSALNVPNPQPGWRYYWCHYHKGSNYSELTSFMTQGWSPVLEGDPEYGNVHGASFLQSQQNVDRLKVFGDVVLFKTPDDNYRRIQEEETTAATNQLFGIAAAHEARGELMAQRFPQRQRPKGRPMYYARADHETYSELVDPNKATTE